ncbi:2-amino-4-hydroxy-6-hydroxymethyldihydropteridine diphosphokinase [Demequina activiva]|uniref:Bifunctional folate synthesis protein n=1 Tax=Demequina activiva TaxID=1582364 RepID=A0A919Q1X6_9MICO|nr:2-amino-4-hydroxy-6-hydroxymethyldihydropteridine diphosphokinase [Demequina activiva]GIG53747.1 hypothetical protein Dac01nite_04990 [Demequina activiva]
MTITARPYVKDGIELDQIAVEGIRVSGYHGVNANEREDGQLFLADVVAHVNTRAAGGGDDLSKTVNYSDLADKAAEVLAGSPFKLIEAVADHIARELLDFEGIQCVDVTVHKPQAPLHVEFKDVTVTIRRDLRDGGLWAAKRIGSSAGFSDDPNSPEGSHAPRDIMDERPAQPVGAIIAMGGNLGEVEPTFREALSELHRVNGVTVVNVSPLVRSTPEGGAQQPDYLNAVARIETSLAPRELLAALHGIEMVHGRDRTVAGAARTLDLDIVTVDGVVGETEDLTLPHPRAHQRGFVVLPWVAMERDAVLEPHGSVADLARQAQFDGVTLVSAEWPRVPAPEASPQTAETPRVAPADEAPADAPADAQAEPPADAPAAFSAPVEDASAQSAPQPQSVQDAPVTPYSAPSAQPSAPEAPQQPSAPPAQPSVPTFQPSASAPSAPAPAPSAPSYQPPATFTPAPASAPEPSVPSFDSAIVGDDQPVSPYDAPSVPAGQWAPVSEESAPAEPSAPQAPSAPQPPTTGTVPTRQSFGVARQSPPPAEGSADGNS